MVEQRYRWKNKQIREQVAILDGKQAPTILLKNARYLNQTFRKWMEANIWIHNDRIVYVGEQLPENVNNCEIIDCKDFYLVPGYIEPHAHPFQLYNPLSFAQYASQFGTTTLINDNMVLALQLSEHKVFSLLEKLKALPTTMFWWCRLDTQTEMLNEEDEFSQKTILSWLDREDVLQGGELTGWPKLVAGDDFMLRFIQETKRRRKKVEGHLPGASEKTLAKMALFGVDCDHEAMTGEEVMRRLMQGYTVSLRYSSIRPDLPKLLEEMHELGINQYDKCLLNTDGSSASFYEQGVTDATIRIAIEKGVPVIDAYNMATINVARYYNMEDLIGNIATGRIAHINFLTDEKNPTPVSVLANGKWVKRDGQPINAYPSIHWSHYGLHPLNIDWDLTEDDLQYSMPFGVEMMNSVITKPYSIHLDVSSDRLSDDHDECFFMLVDKNGKWRINTILKGFTKKLQGLASSYSHTGDIILIGKDKKEMLKAFQRMKEIGGGIVISANGDIICEIPLPLKGVMSTSPVEKIIEEEKKFTSYLREMGYRFEDPLYSLIFFSATHLPYIRITQQGMYDVMNKSVLFPTIMR